MKILSTFMLLLILTNCAGSNMAKVKFGKRCTAADENGLKFHPQEFKDIIYQQTDIINHFKEHFNRARPVEVDPTLNTLPSETNKTRAYPSGHACQATVVARYVAGKVPRLEKQLMAAARECGYGRVLAGFHYVSDYEVGNLLGEKLYIFMNKADYGQETGNE